MVTGMNGEPLSNRIARGPVPAADAARIATDVAGQLAEAHAKGVLHRDVRPGNIIVSQNAVTVVGFGNEPAVNEPHYMSPEQALGRGVDARTDIFSLGSVLYEMLTGTRPFPGDVATQVLLQIVSQEPRDIAAAASAVPHALAQIVRRCMSKQPGDRYRTCAELRDALLGTARGTRRRALIADDDPAARYLLASVLQRHEIEYDEASNGADAVKLLKSTEYALVFVDLLMPRVDGWGVLDYLRNHRRERMPRTYVVTGVQNQKLSTADQDVVAGLLYKPLDIAQVEKLVGG